MADELHSDEHDGASEAPLRPHLLRWPRASRGVLLYVAVSVVALGSIFGVIRAGNAYFDAAAGSQVRAPVTTSASETAVATDHRQPLAVLLLQLLVILGVARLSVGLVRAVGQPAVVGELAAGLALGPSLLGHVFPDVSGFLFQPSSLPHLNVIGEVGVVIYMFVVGLELDPRQLRERTRTAIAVSHASIVVPFLLGVLLAFPLYAAYAGPEASFTAFALFMGVAMSITAFPVLARLLEERQLSRTALGATVLACAGVDDLTAWLLLAAIVTLVTPTAGTLPLVPLALFGGFVLFMHAVLRPLLRNLVNASGVLKGGRTLVLWLVFAAALTTESIGVHAFLGAFVAGVVMPSDPVWRRQLRERVESLSSTICLPAFFASTGLRADLGLISDSTGWMWCLVVIAVATLGKLGGGAVTARLTGMSWFEALRLGALMNTRGLMELVALNIGYELGILSSAMFTILAMMALVTTAMASPLLELGARWQVHAARVETATSLSR